MNEIDEIESKLNKYDLKNKSLVNFQILDEFETIKSEIICIEYSNKVFISISSSGKFGSVLYVRDEKVPGGGGGGAGDNSLSSNTVYSVKTLFGQTEENLETFVRNIADKLRLKSKIAKPILVSVGLKKEHIQNLGLLKHYANIIVEAYTQNN